MRMEYHIFGTILPFLAEYFLFKENEKKQTLFKKVLFFKSREGTYINFHFHMYDG